MPLCAAMANLQKLFFMKKLLTSSSDNIIGRRAIYKYTSLFSSKTQTFPVESKIQDILKQKFPLAEYIEVRDVSGGCGAMFEISVIADVFKGLSIVKQHRMVNEALKEEIKDMHGLRIHTALPSKTN